jgi:putative ABC transport system permease protein
MDILIDFRNNIAFGLLGVVTAILVVLGLLALTNPVLFKLGLRNIPRRPAQSILIVVGLTLSTVIIVASFSTGDTLDYSVRRQAVAAYGQIDEIIAPPLISLFTSISQGDPESAEAVQAQEELDNLFEGGLTSVLAVLEGGLPGVSMERYELLRQQAAEEPLIDGVAGSIVFPTIIRNTSTGQGEPLGFIFAVDDNYDQTFGLTSVEGRSVEVENLAPGVGNIFGQANNLFGMVGGLGEQIGLDLSVSDVATAIAAIGAVVTGAQGGDLTDLNNLIVDAATLESLGVDPTILRDLGIETINVGELVALIPGLGGSTAPTSTSPITTTLALTRVQPISVTAASQIDPQAIVPITTTRVSTGALPIAVTGAATTTSLLDPQVLNSFGDSLLQALNLNTLGKELDRVLSQVGLQLRQGDIYLNRLGAERLNAQAGDVLEVFIGPIPVPFRVRAIIEEAGPMGALLPTVMMRLDEAQQLLFMNNKVNAILVSNLGDEMEGIEHTRAVSTRLSALALDDDALTDIAAILRRPDVAPILERAVAGAQETILPEEMPAIVAMFVQSTEQFGGLVEKIQALPAALAQPEIGDDLREIMVSSDVREWLLEQRFPADARSELTDALARLNQFDLIDPLSKSSVLAVANVGGSIFASLFTVFGFFSIVAGVLLIFLIFVMLAAERRSEMGLARAIGVQRRHLVQMFVNEGMVYSLGAAALGILIGLGVSFLMVEYLGSIFNNLADQAGAPSGGILQFNFFVSPTSIIISYCLGVLLTFIVVTFSSWRVSRLTIVAAIRDMPDEAHARRRTFASRIGRWLPPLLLLAAAGAVLFYGFTYELWSLVLIGVTTALFGVMLLLGRFLDLTHMRHETVNRIVYTLIGAGLLALWVTPWQSVLPQLELDRFASDPTQILATFAIGGPMIVTGAIMIIMFNAQVLTWLVGVTLGSIGSLTPVLKTAIAYPLNARFRTGMTMVLFAMIMATVVVMAVVIEATQSLIVLDETESAGFEVEVSGTLLSFFDPVTDIEQEIATLQADYPLLDQVAAVGTVVSQRLSARQVAPVQATGRANITGLNDGYLTQAEQVYSLRLRAAGYPDDASVWRALRERDDVVIALARTLPALVTQDAQAEEDTPPESEMPEMGMGPEGGRMRDEFVRFRLDGVPANASELPEIFLDLSATDDNNVTRKGRVQVIAVLEDAGMLAEGDLQGNQRLLNLLMGETMTPDATYIKVKPGADPAAVAQEVERALLSSGLDATVMAERFAQGQAFTRNILRLLQGFMALGLLVGIAALGVITTRTVVERRQQVGLLRALGFQARMVALSFMLEASFVAITGILIGAGVGIVLGQNMVKSAFDEIGGFSLPWGQIVLVVTLAYGFSLLATFVPAYQAARIYPAEALRYE